MTERDSRGRPKPPTWAELSASAKFWTVAITTFIVLGTLSLVISAYDQHAPAGNACQDTAEQAWCTP